jgi:hypothetical protein
MSGSEDTLFIALKNDDTNMIEVRPILHERFDQLLSYTTFMSSLVSNSYITQIYFNYSSKSGPIIYSIKKYIDETSGNPGRFCIYINEKKQESLLSDNKTALERHAANQNRIMHQGGNRTKLSRKTKRSKRMHTAKRK